MIFKATNDSKTGNSALIQCQIYDYIEIACMHHYLLDIKLTTGKTIMGKAITTKIKDKQEWLRVTTNDLEEPNELLEIRLDKIKSIQPLDNNAEFRKVKIG